MSHQSQYIVNLGANSWDSFARVLSQRCKEKFGDGSQDLGNFRRVVNKGDSVCRLVCYPVVADLARGIKGIALRCEKVTLDDEKADDPPKLKSRKAVQAEDSGDSESHVPCET